MKVALFAAVCALWPASMLAAAPQPADARQPRLNQVAESYTPRNAFMGAVLVAEGDRILLNKGYGMASLEWSVPNGPQAKFRLGSLTKQFTAALVLQLQQEGKLNIDDPVSKYLPDTPKAWAKITLAYLLGHTSGIPNFTDLKEFGAWRMSPHSLDEELAFFRDRPLEFEPGSKFAYSNSNYEVLGAVLEKVSGQKYADLLRRRILEPVGMRDTGLDTDDLVLPRRAEGYQLGPNGPQVARSESMTVPWAAGSMYSTTADLLKWEHALFDGKVLSPESLKRMTTAGKGDYGLGVMIGEQGGFKVIEHGGGIEGFNTYLMYAPDRRIAVVVLANINGTAPDHMGRQLMRVALGLPVVLASEHKAVPIGKDALAKFVGVYELFPDFSLTVAAKGDGLTMQGTGQPAIDMMYQGEKDGHPRFFVVPVEAEVEFIPDPKGRVGSLILHQNGHDIPGKRQ